MNLVHFRVDLVPRMVRVLRLDYDPTHTAYGNDEDDDDDAVRQDAANP
jgi:hypothetical protein